MYKPVALALACIFVLSGTLLLLPQTNAQTSYYNNNFDTASALNDGYWSLHDAFIQAMGGSNALVVNGEATFLPSHGNYDPLNFTLQFDVSQNVHYDNNTQYQGPFYTGADSAGNVIASLGYYVKTINGSEQLMGGLSFAAQAGGLTYSHYYFLFDQTSDWSTWSLTFLTTQINPSVYRANVTVAVNNQTVTSFDTGLPNADGNAELWVPTITNEPIYVPITVHNFLPLPMAGAPVPTYAPTAQSNNAKHFTLLSNTKVQSLAANGATASYIDNFYYGYANTVPTSNAPTPIPTTAPTQNANTATPTQTAAATQTQPPNNGPTQPPQNEPFPTTSIIALVVGIVAVAFGALLFLKKRQKKLKQQMPTP